MGAAIQKGDFVLITSGDSKGETGIVSDEPHSAWQVPVQVYDSSVNLLKPFEDHFDADQLHLLYRVT